MKKQNKLKEVDMTVITSIIISMLLVSFIWWFIFSTQIKQEIDKVIYECDLNEWEGFVVVDGSSIDCVKYWFDYYSNWNEFCSDFPLDNKPSCKYMCVIDCRLQNKIEGETW